MFVLLNMFFHYIKPISFARDATTTTSLCLHSISKTKTQRVGCISRYWRGICHWLILCTYVCSACFLKRTVKVILQECNRNDSKSYVHATRTIIYCYQLQQLKAGSCPWSLKIYFSSTTAPKIYCCIFQLLYHSLAEFFSNQNHKI